MIKKLPEQSYLKNIIYYYEKTGAVVRIKRTGPSGNLGVLSTGLNSHGYKRIGLDNSRYYLHRIIWKYMTGDEPEQIDHINGDTTDNRWSNLRNVSKHENNKNAKKRMDNSSGISGVSFDGRIGMWSAFIRAGGKQMFLGNHHTIFDAAAARKVAQNRYGYHANHGRD